MKYAAFSLLLFILIAGGLSISYSKEENTTTVQISIDDPARAAKAMGTIIEKAESPFYVLPETAQAQSFCEGTAETTVYRIRYPDYSSSSQIGAYHCYETAIDQCRPGYCVFDESGRLLYSNATA